MPTVRLHTLTPCGAVWHCVSFGKDLRQKLVMGFYEILFCLLLIAKQTIKIVHFKPLSTLGPTCHQVNGKKQQGYVVYVAQPYNVCEVRYCCGIAVTVWRA